LANLEKSAASFEGQPPVKSQNHSHNRDCDIHTIGTESKKVTTIMKAVPPARPTMMGECFGELTFGELKFGELSFGELAGRRLYFFQMLSALSHFAPKRYFLSIINSFDSIFWL
jgi:hypothetical protein